MPLTGYFLSDFARDVGASYKASHHETFWSCGEHLSRLLSGDGVADFLNGQLQRLISDPSFGGDWSANTANLYRTSSWSLSVVTLDSLRRYIHAVPELAYYVPLAGEGLTADRYQLPPDYRNELFDPGVKLEPAGVVTAATGELLKLETDIFAYDFRITRPLLIARLMTAPLRPLEWLFSKTTLQAWQVNDADLAYTQLRVAAYVLGRIAHQSSVQPLKNLSSHPHHAVRWAAIQNLGRLNRSEALIKIREAINDPHPHVRRAAQKTLDQIEKKRPAP